MTTPIRISAGKQKKIDTVKQLSDKLSRTKTLFLTDYRGLTHQQLTTLRKALKKVEAEFVVAKNRLFKIAIAQDAKTQPFDLAQGKSFKETEEKIIEQLNNPTATFLAYGDEIAAIKVLANFIKNVQLPKIKIGIFAGKLTSSQEFNTLATIPSYEVLISTLAVRLKSPLYGLHYALKWNLQRLVTVLGNIKVQELGSKF